MPAIIVFGGGLNLDLRGLRAAGSGVKRLVVLALPLNRLLSPLAGHYRAAFRRPTVIMPLLRQAKLAPRPASFPEWEAIGNDPIDATPALSFRIPGKNRTTQSASA